MSRKSNASGSYTAAGLTLADGDDIDFQFDDKGNLKTAATGSPSTIGDGSRAVTTAGTDVALIVASTPCRSVTIQAYESNTGFIAVGASGVDAATAGDGVRLASGDTFSFDIANLSSVFIDATVSGEGVRFTYTV